jgi:hypothetical protein
MSNVETVPGLSLYCPRIKGEQKGSDTGGEAAKPLVVPPCSPLSSYKEYKKNGIREGNNTISKTNSTEEYKNIYKTIRKNGGTREQGGTNFSPPNPPDSRLSDPLFAASVRTVLEYLGLESTQGNFRKYDSRHGGSIKNWPAFADRISFPRMTAEVAVKGGRGAMLFCVDLPGRSREEAIGKLDTNCYGFRRWL